MTKPLHFPLAQKHLELTTEEGTVVKRSVLPGGVRVLTEKVPAVKGVTVGFWVPIGSRDEKEVGFGSTHFLEHLLFKSTKNRTPLEIAVAFDEIGGSYNAMTAHEYTCYYATVRDQDLPVAIEVLSDMFTGALFEAGEFETERKVILEELAMTDDDPSEAAAELFYSKILTGHPIGRPIGGTKESIRQVGRDSVVEHYQQNYRPDTLIVTAAGAVEHEEFCERLLTALTSGGWALASDQAPASRRPTNSADTVQSPEPVTVQFRKGEQVNLFLGTLGIPSSSEDRFTLSVLNSILGGGMSSRLFQSVREQRGLVYSIDSDSDSFSDLGVFSINAATAPEQSQTVVDLILAELEQLKQSGVSEAELQRVQGKIAGQMALQSERSAWRMRRLGGTELGTGDFYDYSNTLESFQQVNLAGIQALAQKLFSQSMTLVALGDIESKELKL